MMTDAILKALEAFGLKEKGRGEYRCRSPFRPDSDSDSFTYNSDKGIGHDMVTDTGYNRFQIARHLGIELPDETERIPVASTLRSYRDLTDYAREQGVPFETFERAGWKTDSYQNRPCFSFPTQNGTRYRFTDGQKPKYKSQEGYKECWYGLDKALQMGKEMLVLCNGEASTIVAQHYGIPAFCKTAGERRIPPNLVDEFTAKGFDGQLWIALDCDATGRKQSAEIKYQFPDALVIDLELGDKGDLANFCKLNTRDSFKALQLKVPEPRPIKPDMVYAHSVAIDAIASIEEAETGYPLVVPFECMHEFGGYAEILLPGKLVMVMAATGAGKTSWLESWADFWLRRGIGGVWRGDEFSPLEYLHRRIQRYSGISMRMIDHHKLALREEKNNVPVQYRHGHLMSAAAIDQYQQACGFIADWSGNLAYYEGGRDKKALEPMLDIMTREIQNRRKTGEIVAFAVFDYIQLMRTISKPVDDNAYEHSLGLIKEWTIDMDIVSMVGTQITKSASTDIRQNRRQEAQNAMYVRLDKANLAIAPRILYMDDPSGAVDEEGKPRRIFTGQGVASILKNSTGGIGDVPVVPDFARLQWLAGKRERYDFGEE